MTIENQTKIAENGAENKLANTDNGNIGGEYIISGAAFNATIKPCVEFEWDEVKQLVYDWHVAGAKKGTHAAGKKFYFVRWDYRTNCETYYLAYTTSHAEDEKIIADGRWERITRRFAMELVGRGGHIYGDNAPNGLGDYLTALCRDDSLTFSPICPYVTDEDMQYVIDAKTKLLVAVRRLNDYEIAQKRYHWSVRIV